MTDMELDRISCLPDHMIDQILSLLPIKDAGRTSILSSEWRKKWSTQSNLVFDRQCVSAASSEDPSVIKNKFLRIIDDVILLHSGPINKVKISDSGCDIVDMNSVAAIDRWILYLTMELDRISCLPDHMIDQILSLLPIKEAGRTSVLSSKWRKKWSTQPVLVFDNQCVSGATSQDPSVIESKFVSIIDHVLLLHSGPINKFEVSDSNSYLIGVNSMAHIDSWILHLIGRSIKELVLDIWFEQRYKIPWCLFSCQSLRHLNLYSCCLKPPTTFKGFRNLKILELEQVTMTQDAFERLISGSPLLEELILRNFDGFTQLNIRAPNLKLILIAGKCKDISFDNTSQLASVYLDLKLYLNSKNNQSRLHGCSSNLLKVVDHLPHIKNLKIITYFLKYLAAGDVPVELPTPCINLKSLSLCINFNDLKQISVVLCLLKSSPNLRKLGMIVPVEEQTSLLTPASYCWEDLFSEPDTPLTVRHMKIKGISGTKSELGFIRFLLLYSPVLKKMIVKLVVNVKPELMIELLRFRRASARAEIIYHGNDSS